MATIASPPVVAVAKPEVERHNVCHSPRFESCRLNLNADIPDNMTPQEIVQEFKRSINMSADDLEEFLSSEESRMAVAEGDDADRQGRHMARRIIELLNKLEDGTGQTLYEGDYLHMWQVAAYVNCRLGKTQRLEGSDARKSTMFCTSEIHHLKNFGRDVLKDEVRRLDESLQP